ncbi:uncharacterized protein B0I36DRAFT_4435 [Microdochium trichocladiopsis]|uniref:Uncharacterized protein n=1 Tax=Microdochium trichocladiopsis TaxID=1682393 RepID=A0A9P9BZE0_9PEZI|nr:uncharacterized protein B0I36DRAFT_4435 [Microdochium trichocladiopsis]KAH7040004.1 hypothetical protein B0I36DRAFT_4435 [Microdochium trichocladiopsis]
MCSSQDFAARRKCSRFKRATTFHGNNSTWPLGRHNDDGNMDRPSDPYYRRPDRYDTKPQPYGLCQLPSGCPQRARLADECLSDLNTDNPFTIAMVVREDERRIQIQSQIAGLHPHEQTEQRHNEEIRIQAWNRIKALHDRQDSGWKRLRDEYVAADHKGDSHGSARENYR